MRSGVKTLRVSLPAIASPPGACPACRRLPGRLAAATARCRPARSNLSAGGAATAGGTGPVLCVIDHLIDDPVGQRVFGGHVVVALDVLADAILPLPGAAGEHLYLRVAEALPLRRLDLQVGDVAVRFPERLVEHQGGELIS